jgi:hypothetical protein
MLKIEIFEEDVRVDVRTTKAKDDKPARKIYEQVAYVYLGGKFPTQMKLSLDEEQKPYSAGMYTVDSSSYVVNNFGSLELKRFGLSVVALESEL